MKFEAAVRRIEVLPDRLPAPPEALMPVRTDGGWGTSPPIRSLPATARAAAVLVLLVPGADGLARVVLTERVSGGSDSGLAPP